MLLWRSRAFLCLSQRIRATSLASATRVTFFLLCLFALIATPTMTDTTMEDIKDVSSSFKGKGKAKVPESNGQPDVDLLPWVEKYRPVSLDDLVSHQDITSTIERFIEKNRLPHLLFYGPPGTGKTSTILAMARKIYGANFKNNVLEVSGGKRKRPALLTAQPSS